MTAQEIIDQALADGRTTLSERQSKQVLAEFGVTVTREEEATDAEAALAAAEGIGYPVVLKANAPGLAHKTEDGLVEIGLEDARALQDAAARLLAKLPAGGGLLVQEMARGKREFLVGMKRDAQYGPCVSFGLGGIFAEALDDVSLALAPVTQTDAMAMMESIRAKALLGAWRGMPTIDREALARTIMGVGAAAIAHPEIAEIDVNPVIIADDRPVAVDALVVLTPPTE